MELSITKGTSSAGTSGAQVGADVITSLLRTFYSRRVDLAIVGTAIAAGLICRYAALDYKTADTSAYLLPWYDYARLHGVAALGHTFTNYTPFYSYLLLIATRFDGIAAPWYLIKAI